MAYESVLRIPAKLEGMDVILAFVSLLLDTHGCSAKARTQLCNRLFLYDEKV